MQGVGLLIEMLARTLSYSLVLLWIQLAETNLLVYQQIGWGQDLVVPDLGVHLSHLLEDHLGNESLLRIT